MSRAMKREDDGFVALCQELDIASQFASIEESPHESHCGAFALFHIASASEISRRAQSKASVTQVRYPLDKLPWRTGTAPESENSNADATRHSWR